MCLIFTSYKRENEHTLLIPPKIMTNSHQKAQAHCKPHFALPHAWSLAMIGGEYYLFDVTWDDSGEAVSYTYFAITTKEMEKTHLANPKFTYPTCTATTYNYYVKEGLLLEAYSFEEADRIISAQSSGGATASLKFTDKAEYDKAIEELITDQKWTKLTAFQNVKKLSYVANEEKLILKFYFPTE